jgi:hypothetical protein
MSYLANGSGIQKAARENEAVQARVDALFKRGFLRLTSSQDNLSKSAKKVEEAEKRVSDVLSVVIPPFISVMEAALASKARISYYALLSTY